MPEELGVSSRTNLKSLLLDGEVAGRVAPKLFRYETAVVLSSFRQIIQNSK